MPWCSGTRGAPRPLPSIACCSTMWPPRRGSRRKCADSFKLLCTGQHGLEGVLLMTCTTSVMTCTTCVRICTALVRTSATLVMACTTCVMTCTVLVLWTIWLWPSICASYTRTVAKQGLPLMFLTTAGDGSWFATSHPPQMHARVLLVYDLVY